MFNSQMKGIREKRKSRMSSRCLTLECKLTSIEGKKTDLGEKMMSLRNVRCLRAPRREFQRVQARKRSLGCGHSSVEGSTSGEK